MDKPTVTLKPLYLENLARLTVSDELLMVHQPIPNDWFEAHTLQGTYTRIDAEGLLRIKDYAKVLIAVHVPTNSFDIGNLVSFMDAQKKESFEAGFSISDIGYEMYTVERK